MTDVVHKGNRTDLRFSGGSLKRGQLLNTTAPAFCKKIIKERILRPLQRARISIINSLVDPGGSAGAAPKSWIHPCKFGCPNIVVDQGFDAAAFRRIDISLNSYQFNAKHLVAVASHCHSQGGHTCMFSMPIQIHVLYALIWS